MAECLSLLMLRFKQSYHSPVSPCVYTDGLSPCTVIHQPKGLAKVSRTVFLILLGGSVWLRVGDVPLSWLRQQGSGWSDTVHSGSESLSGCHEAECREWDRKRLGSSMEGYL